MYKSILSAVVFAASLTLNQAAVADSWGCGEGMKQMLQSLKLDDAQKDKIKPILEQMKAAMVTSGKPMKDLDTQINALSSVPGMHQASVDALVDKKSKLIGDMIKAKVSAKIQIFSVLNEKQRAELQGMMQKLEDKMAEKFKSCHKDD